MSSTSRRSSLNKSALAVIAATAATLSLSALAAGAETTAPQIVTVAARPGTVNVGVAEQSVALEASVQAGIAPVNLVQLRLTAPGTDGAQIFCSSAALVSGNATQGVYRCSVVVPKESVTGSWTATATAWDKNRSRSDNPTVTAALTVTKSTAPAPTTTTTTAAPTTTVAPTPTTTVAPTTATTAPRPIRRPRLRLVGSVVGSRTNG